MAAPGVRLCQKLKGDNPASCLVGVLKKADSEGYPTFENRNDAGEFLRRLTEYHDRSETRLAVWLLMLTAKRPSELRASAWSKFDLNKAEWLNPAERMKTRQSHLVILSRQAVAALNELHSLTSYTGLLFPGALHRLGFSGESGIVGCVCLRPKAEFNAAARFARKTEGSP
ncbi:MAG: tyrosine-type recombinase/integrase [Sulfuricella sp.]